MKKIFKLLLLLSWMGVIFFLSSQTGDSSSKLSDGLLFNIINILNIDEHLATYYLDLLGYPIRKLAHFSEYAILAALTIYLIRDYCIDNKKIIIYTILFCFLYAISDEVHQLFIPNRAGSIIDVFIDTSGAVLSNIIYLILCKKHVLH